MADAASEEEARAIELLRRSTEKMAQAKRQRETALRLTQNMQEGAQEALEALKAIEAEAAEAASAYEEEMASARRPLMIC